MYKIELTDGVSTKPFLFDKENKLAQTGYISISNKCEGDIDVFLVMMLPVNKDNDLSSLSKYITVTPVLEIPNPAYNAVTNPSVSPVLNIDLHPISPDFTKIVEGQKGPDFVYIACLSEYLNVSDGFTVSLNVEYASVTLYTFGRACSY